MLTTEGLIFSARSAKLFGMPCACEPPGSAPGSAPGPAITSPEGAQCGAGSWAGKGDCLRFHSRTPFCVVLCAVAGRRSSMSVRSEHVDRCETCTTQNPIARRSTSAVTGPCHRGSVVTRPSGFRQPDQRDAEGQRAQADQPAGFGRDLRQIAPAGRSRREGASANTSPSTTKHQAHGQQDRRHYCPADAAARAPSGSRFRGS